MSNPKRPRGRAAPPPSVTPKTMTISDAITKLQEEQVTAVKDVEQKRGELREAEMKLAFINGQLNFAGQLGDPNPGSYEEGEDPA